VLSSTGFYIIILKMYSTVDLSPTLLPARLQAWLNEYSRLHEMGMFSWPAKKKCYQICVRPMCRRADVGNIVAREVDRASSNHGHENFICALEIQGCVKLRARTRWIGLL
jgi:hypothetical protein